MFRLDGKSALVTGASGGIGNAIAKALHAQGQKSFCPVPVRRHCGRCPGELGERLMW